jgi:hypothetical protein
MSNPLQPVTYDPTLIVISFAANLITGYADGTFVKVARNADLWKAYIGADGKVARAKNADKSGVVTLTIASTSPSNDILSAAAIQDEKTSTGAYPFLMKDQGGTSIASSQLAWVQKIADIEMGKEVVAREWAIFCPELYMLAGSN